jgi:membrane-bound metal-dependent hydrolase YbcI (DUF457 family)
MTATNHVLAGAVVALAVKQPALAIPLAVLSHFLLDALPHYGFESGTIFEHSKHKRSLTQLITPVDGGLAIVILLWLGFFLDASVPNLLIVICAFAAYVPDILWLPTFIKELRTHVWEPRGWFLKLHQKIQWRERPWGIYVELAWAVGAVAAILALA